MGKASSNKKIAKAQRAGQKSTAGRQRSFLFPFSLVLVVVLGLALVVFARDDRAVVPDEPPTFSDNWSMAYSIVICDEFQPEIDPTESSKSGIRTKGDGVIHVEPFKASEAGKNARFDRFFESSGLEVTHDKISVPGGKEAIEGETKCGDEDGTIRVARWTDASTVETTEPQVFTNNFGDIRFLGDREAITFFFGPENAKIPPPDTISELDQLPDPVDSGSLDPGLGLDPETGEPLAPGDGAPADSSVPTPPADPAEESDTAPTTAGE